MTVSTFRHPASPGTVRARTDKTRRPPGRNDACVPTQPTRPQRPEWPLEDFFRWFDATKDRLELGSDNQAAAYLGIGHTLISGWRNNRQRPSFESLNQIGRVLEMDPRHLWVLAGLVTPGEVGLLEEDQPTRLALPAAVVELLDLLQDPRLDDAAREQLLGTVRVLVAGTKAGLPGEPPATAPWESGSPRGSGGGRKAS